MKGAKLEERLLGRWPGQPCPFAQLSGPRVGLEVRVTEGLISTDLSPRVLMC